MRAAQSSGAVRRTLTFATAFCCLAALVFAATAGAADSLYWTNDGGGTIGRAALDGSGGSIVTPSPGGADEPYGTAIDAATGTVYWADTGSNSIRYSALDGLDAGTLNTAGSGIDGPEGIAIAPAEGRVYWANIDNDTISWANLDGSGGGVLNTAGAPIQEPAGVAVDPAEGRIYWASYGDSLIGWAALDGSGGGELETDDDYLEGPVGLAIDPLEGGGTIYWANWDSGTIGASELGLPGSGTIIHLEPTVESLAGIAIDPEADLLYWAAESGAVGTYSMGTLRSSELNLSGAEPSEPSFPVLLEKPAAVPTTVPDYLPDLHPQPGATLACRPPAWEPDLVESFLYRAPQTLAYSWTLEGKPIEGATGPTLVAVKAGEYHCRVTATNGAGSTTAKAGEFFVTSPSLGETPVAREPERIRIAKVVRDPRHGTATVVVSVTGPGAVRMFGPRIVGRRAKATAAGTVRLKLTPKGNARRALLDGGKAKVVVELRFTPGSTSVHGIQRVISLSRTPPGSGREHRRHRS